MTPIKINVSFLVILVIVSTAYSAFLSRSSENVLISKIDTSLNQNLLSCIVNDLCMSASIVDLNYKEIGASNLELNISVKPSILQLNKAVGRNFYISESGNDENAGTDPSMAWATFAGGIKTIAGGLKGGDSICYLSGVYRNPNYGDGNYWKSSPADTVINVAGISGSEGAYISISPCEGHKVKIEFDSAVAIRITSSSFIRVSGFEVEGFTQKLTLSDALQYQYAYRYIGTTEILYRNPDLALKSLLKNVEKPAAHNQNAITVGNGCHHIDLFDLYVHDSTGHGIAALGGVDYVNIIHNEFVNTTWWSSNGNHAVSFKGLKSIDSNNDFKIIVRGNLLRDCASKLISWSLQKTAIVEKVIDEGKGLHCQDSTVSNGWVNGKVLFADNLIIRQGNAGVTVNNAERVTFANNTMVDNANLNEILKRPGESDPNVVSGYSVDAAGIRASGGKQCSVLNNVIVQKAGNNAFDAPSSSTAADYTLKGNVYNGGNPTNANALNNLEAIRAVTLPIFQNPSVGDYSVIDKDLNAGVGLTSTLCVELSWPEAKASFFGTNSSCADVVLNGVGQIPLKQLNIDLGDSLTIRGAGENLEVRVRLSGKITQDVNFVETIYTIK